jgi:hypothetical protein
MSVIRTKLLDGPRHAIFHFAIDGTEQDEMTDYVLIDPKDDITPAAYKLVVEDVLYNFAGFDAKIHFDSDVVEGIMTWVLPQGSDSYVDFRSFGGFKDRSGINGDGKLKLTTKGLGMDEGDMGSMIVRVRKSQDA